MHRTSYTQLRAFRLDRLSNRTCVDNRSRKSIQRSYDKCVTAAYCSKSLVQTRSASASARYAMVRVDVFRRYSILLQSLTLYL